MNQEQAARTAANARRRFLAACGKFAIATPPAINLIMVCSKRNYAAAISGGAQTSDQAHSAASSLTPSSSRK